MNVVVANLLYASREYAMRLVRGIAWRLLHAARRPVASTGRSRSVLVVEMTRMGDVVFAAELANGLRQSLRGVKVGLGVSPAYVSLARLLAPGTIVVPIQAGVLEYLHALMPGQGDKWDLGVTASPALRNLVALFAAGCRSVDGYLRPPGRWWAYRPEARLGIGTPGSRTVPSEHLRMRANRIMEAVCARFGRRPRYQGMKAAGARARLRKVVLHAGGVWRFRRWPAERWVTLARLLRSRRLEVTLVLGPENAEEVSAFGALLGSGVEIRNAPSLPELVRLLRSAGLFIGPDSGVMHLAGAMGARAVALMGPSLPCQSGPLAPGSRVVQGKVPCAPCSQCLCVRPFTPCMARIGVRAVVDAVFHRRRGEA